MADLGNRAQVGSDVEQGLGSMASLQAVSEEEWHEEVANLSPKELVEATFQRLFPGTFLYALPIWKHKVVLLHPHALHPARRKSASWVSGRSCILMSSLFHLPHCNRIPIGTGLLSLLGTERWRHTGCRRWTSCSGSGTLPTAGCMLQRPHMRPVGARPARPTT